MNFLLLLSVVLSLRGCFDSFTAAVIMNYQPVVDVNGSTYCANDTPSAVVALRDIVGIPDGVPDAVRCGYVCTGYVNCTSFNCRSGIITTSASSSKSGSGSFSGDTWGSICELYNYIPRHCTTPDVRESNCIHYQVPRKRSSCLPYVCDADCAGSCDVQGPGKCDAQCRPGFALSSNYTCGVNCPSGFSLVGSQNNCYKLIDRKLSMTDASTTCRNLTGGSNDSHLVYVNNAIETRDIATYIRGLPAASPGAPCYSANWAASLIWNGACRASHTGYSQFVWANQCSDQGLAQSAVSQAMNYTNWRNGDPDDAGYSASTGAGGEYCVQMSLKADGSALWLDVACFWQECSLCELERPSA